MPERVAPRSLGGETRLGVEIGGSEAGETVFEIGRVAPGRVEIHLAPAPPDAPGAAEAPATPEAAREEAAPSDGAGSPPTAAALRATARLRARRRFPWLEVALDERCELAWGEDEGPPAWRPCTFTTPRDYADATLRVRFEGPPGATLWMSDPLWIPRATHEGALSWVRERLAPATPPPPPVFVVLLDTVRLDAFVPRSEDPAPGPHWARLAADAVLFANARSSSAWTRTATASLFTGLRPWGHGVFGRLDVLDARLDTLPEILRRQGYETFAWSANPNVLPLWGFAQGFDRFVDLGAGAWAQDKTDAARFLDELRPVLQDRGARPALYYLHLMDAHSPYEPDPDDLERVEALGLAERFRPAVKERPEVAESYRRYLGEIVDLDQWLGSFVALLREAGLYERSAILLVSDHGEEFLDHGGLLHGRTLYEEMLHVPVLLKLPDGSPGAAGARGTRVPRAVRLEDLLPTLLQGLGLEGPGAGHGESLLEAPAEEDPPQLAVLHLDGRRQSAAVLGPWKLVVYPNLGREALYDLTKDPEERHNVRAAHPEKARELRWILGAAAALHQEGWHVRACGSDAARTLRLRLTGPGAHAETRDLEPADRVEGALDALGIEAALELVPTTAQREHFGKLVDVPVRDHDEILVTEGEPDAGRLALAALGAAPLRYTLGPDPTVREARSLVFSDQREAATLPPGGLVECFADRVHREAAEAGGQPYLRLWYVPPPARLLAEDVDPALAERLRALGYHW